MVVVIKKTEKLGLEVYQIYVNGTFLCERLSEQGALHKANELMARYNNNRAAA